MTLCTDLSTYLHISIVIAYHNHAPYKITALTVVPSSHNFPFLCQTWSEELMHNCKGSQNVMFMLFGGYGVLEDITPKDY